MQVGIVVALTAVLLGWGNGTAAAAEVETLYEAQALVTGQGEDNRRRAFATCLEAVLVKVSGDPRVPAEPTIAAQLPHASRLVRDFSYRDLLAGIPIHDEQGTRDRPYEVTVRFVPAEVDALLRQVGRAPWGPSRPRVAVVLGVEMGRTRYLLARDGERGRDQRESLAAAAARFGLPIVLPDEATLAGLGASAGKVTDAGRLGGDVILAGDLVWSDRALGWTAAWRLRAQGRTHRWQIRGVNFDEAFRRAMRGTLQILSGRGAP